MAKTQDPETRSNFQSYHQKKVYSISEFTRELKGVLEVEFDGLWVEGEISGFTAARSGHWYFTLKDEAAQLGCVMFRGSNRYIAEAPKEGALLLVHGRINVYEPRGAYQLIADSLEDRGAGRLREQFEALKRRLAEEGLFDPDLKRPLPKLPERIAVVTSPEGAALRDVIRVVLRRFPRVALVVVPTLVQGAGAPGEIVAAIERAGRLDGVEVLIVGRGGGSVEDLWAFNDEAVARAVRACPVPVISAVGHEVDFTITDFAADVRAATPSMAGELVVPVLGDLEAELKHLASRLGRGMSQRITWHRLELQRLVARLPAPDRRIADQRLRLDALTHRMISASSDRQRRESGRLETLWGRLARRQPGRRFERRRAQFNDLAGRLKHGLAYRLREERERFSALAVKLDALSPLGVLARGYSLVTGPSGRLLRSAADVAPGDRLTVHPFKGELTAEVREVRAVRPKEA